MVVTNGLMARSLIETSRLSKKTTERATTSEKAEEKKDEDRPSEDIDYSGADPCPQEGCIRVFQSLSNLKRHLSVEKCSRSLERLSLLDLAKDGIRRSPTGRSLNYANPRTHVNALVSLSIS